MDLQDTLNIAINVAKAAGELLLRGRSQQKEIQRKSSAVDLVTQYDTAAEAMIVEQIKRAFPEHRLLAEEGGRSDNVSSPYIWYIDPLDGTNNYAHGYPVFSISLALYEDDRPLLGVVYDPTRNECFCAVAGQGARLIRDKSVEAIQVSQEEALIDSLLATGFPYDRHTSTHDNLAQLAAFLKRTQGIRRAGSAALDLAYVATGRLDGYWEFKLSRWDVAAGALLVQEAGGVVTDIDGGPLRMTPSMSPLASNGRIHQAMLDVLNEVERTIKSR